MYCNQCEQTAGGVACIKTGVCGKNSEVAALQDILLHAVQSLSIYARAAREVGLTDAEVDRFTSLALFTTLTNVNFDQQRFLELVRQAVKLREELRRKLGEKGADPANTGSRAAFIPANTLEGLTQQGEKLGLIVNHEVDRDIRSLQEILLYGMKGIAAYAYHAALLGQEDERVYEYVHRALNEIGSGETNINKWLDLLMECGEKNLLAMELLDRGHTSTFGDPVPTSIPLGHRPGKCIMVSGHDLKDLLELLKATKGKGIDIYTHGEMLPAHGYPVLKKYPHLYGHYGTAWQNQKKEFAGFPGPILMTTNCIQEPQESYRDHIYTTGPVGWPGVKHVEHEGFEIIVQAALDMPGFTDELDKGTVMTGFAHRTVLGLADQILSAVQDGALKHIFLVGGCDGARGSRSYYTDFVLQTPPDTAVLTLGCGKFRFFDKQIGSIGDIPRLLDVGQCNDAYSAIQIAMGLSQALNCGVNELPLSLVLSWYEQKAVSILLTLLYLGIKDIRLGPTLPAFVSPAVLEVLVNSFGIKPISSVEEDLKAILG